MRSDAARAPTWTIIGLTCGILVAGTIPASAADYSGPYGWAPPPGPPPAYAPRPYRHHQVAVAVTERPILFDDPTAAAAELLDLQPAPPAPDVVARRERLLPVGIIYNVPADPFLRRRHDGPVIRANY